MSSDPTGEFHRIRRLPPYVFAEVNTAKAKARVGGEDIIDLGMGNPDSPTPPHIVAKLVEAVQDPRTHRYSVSKGIPGLRRALAGYYRRRFDVGLDPETEVIATLGSKEGLANLASAITSPGDTILVPNPSYPIHQFGFIIAGAAVRSVPATPDEEMLRALDRAVRHSVPKPTALIVNFPSNPTAYLADLDFYREIVGVRPPARDLDHVRSRLCRDLLRRQGAAVAAAGAGREGDRGRVHQPVQDLLDAGLAHGLRRRQCAADQRADADEVVSGLWRLHADPGCRGRRAERAAGLRRSDPRAVPGAPRRADPRPGIGRLGGAEPGGVDVRLGADPAAVRRSGQRGVLQAAAGARQGGGVAGPRVRRARRGVSSASRWWRIPTGCARRCGTSGRSCRPGSQLRPQAGSCERPCRQ